MNDESDLEVFAPWLVIFITMVGAAVRVFMLGFKGMWLDETFSVWLANHSTGEMLRWVVQIDQHPPLYYLILHSWVGQFGDSPYASRMPSVIFGAAAIPFIYLIGKRLSGVPMGLAAAMLLAFSPFNIRYAQETRMYTLLTFNVAVAIYALIRLLTDPRASQPIGTQFREYWRAWRIPAPIQPKAQGEFSYRDETTSNTGWRGWIARHTWLPVNVIETDLSWLALIVFTALALLTHNTAVLFLLAINLYVLGLLLFQRGKKPTAPHALQAPSPGNWIKAQLGIFLLWTPWIVPFFQQSSRVYQEFWVQKPDSAVILQTLLSLVNDMPPGRDSRLPIMWVMYVVALLFAVVYFRKAPSRFTFLAVLFATPIVGELLISLRRPIFLDRTLIWTTIPLLLALAAGITLLRFRFVMFVVVALFVTNNLSATTDYFRYAWREDWSNPAGYVANFAQEGDLILFNAGWVQIPFDYYFEDYENLYAIKVEKHGLPEDMFASGVLEPKMTESDVPKLLSLLQGRERVWLVYSHNHYTDPMGLIPQTIATEMKLVQQRDFRGVQVQWYEAP